MAKLSETLRQRGYVYQHSSETLEEITDGEKRTLYWGVDPSANSLHVGNLMGVLVLRRFIEAGHKLIVIVGGGTGMIGDPGGKSEERNLLSDEVVQKNSESLRKQFSQLFGGTDFQMINNADWLKQANLMEFLRDIGKHFTVNEMIKRDSVRPRIEAPDQSISFTEFSYMLLQAYDYLHLHLENDCTLQVGASDQWGNMVSGVDLIRRKAGNAAYAFSWPLLVNKSTGKKFGKSESGAVWLDAQKTSPFQFYQFWLNAEDEVVGEYLLKMTMLEQSEIESIMANHLANPGARIAQTALAKKVTTLVHGEEEAARAERVSAILFGDTDINDLAAKDLETLKTAAPSHQVHEGDAIIDALVSAQLASSKREARLFLSEGAISLNGQQITDTERTLAASDFNNGIALLKRGKRSVCVLVLE